ncbi:MAG: hypothetical protein EOM67_03665 [Spirochaetia bacterium]|nr:hypothetical protein [Spirochaetia bacterium]
MDAVSYSHADKQKQRIEKIIAQPDSTSGLVSLPSTIASGETITIPAGRTVVHPNLQVDGTLTVDGTLFIPSGGTYSATEVDATVVKQNGNVVANDSAVIHNTGAETKAGVLTLTDGLILQGQNVSPFSGFKNYIINGGFDVWQRGTLGFDVTNGLSGTYCDMYRYANVTGQGTLSLSKSTISYSGQTYTSLKATVSSPLALSGVAYGHYFSIEDKNAKNLVNKEFTISFLMEVNYAGNYSFSIRKINDDGGTTTSFLKLIQCVAGVNKVTITVPADASYISSNSTTGRGLNISIGTYVSTDTSTTEGWQSGNLASISSAYKWITQSGAYINIAQVQLEEGSVATPFEKRPYGLELSLCQRYYEVLGVGYGVAKDASSMVLHFSASPKRIQPTGILLTSALYGESPINITAIGSTASTLAALMNQQAHHNGGYMCLVTGFNSMTANTNASINANLIALLAEL